jgi:uncharacterized protein
MMLKKLGVFIFLILLSGCSHINNTSNMPTISINDTHEFEVTIADSNEERMSGLQHVSDLKNNEGMWFVFDAPQVLSFWMKDTLISLDIIFVNENLEIINIAENVPPCREASPEQLFCESYFSDEPASYVLEINGGLSEELGILKGDVIKLLNFEDAV